MRYLVLVLLLIAACEVPPVWTPGDGALTFHAENDRAWTAVEDGCALWVMTGLTCERVNRGADVEVRVSVLSNAAQAPMLLDWGLDWTYAIEFSETTLDNAEVAATAAHEIGHLLGMVDHLADDEGPAVMTNPHSAAEVTAADLDYLASVWGESPWED